MQKMLTVLQSLSCPTLQPSYAPCPFPVVRGAEEQVFDDPGNAH